MLLNGHGCDAPVLKNMFSCFSIPELIGMKLVNKPWKVVAEYADLPEIRANDDPLVQQTLRDFDFLDLRAFRRARHQSCGNEQGWNETIHRTLLF